MTGGRGCQKSYANARKIALQLVKDPNFSVVCIRQVFNTHKDSTYSELTNALDDFGIRYRATVNPLQIQVGSNIVYFRGLDDVEKLKGFKPKTTPIKCVWFFEITEFSGSMAIRQAVSSLSRGVKDYFQCIYEYNPPPHRVHWVYDWVEQCRKSDKYHVQFNTLFDIPEDIRWTWLGESFKTEVETLKEIDIELFTHIYLGQPARVVGMIYNKFNFDTHVVENLDIHDVVSLNIGVDWGMSDATTFVASGITQSGHVKVFKEYYHKNGVTGGRIKDINDYVSDLVEFVRSVRDEYKGKIDIYLDSANLAQYQLCEGAFTRTHLRVNLYKTNKLNRIGYLKGHSAIAERIVVTNVLIGNNMLHIDSSCKNLIEAFETAEYDKRGDRLDDGTFNVDSLDAFEYSILKNLKYLYENILGGLNGN